MAVRDATRGANTVITSQHYLDRALMSSAEGWGCLRRSVAGARPATLG
jgi:hypothetical protein